MSKHTPGKLDIKHEWNLFVGERPIASTGGYTSNREPSNEQNAANAERIKACWNAMEGIDDPAAFAAAVDDVLRAYIWNAQGLWAAVEALRLARGEVRR